MRDLMMGTTNTESTVSLLLAMATAALCGAGRHAARRLALAPGAGAVRATSLLPPLAARGPGGAGGARLLSSVPSAFIVPSLPRLAAARAVAGLPPRAPAPPPPLRAHLPRHARLDGCPRAGRACRQQCACGVLA